MTTGHAARLGVDAAAQASRLAALVVAVGVTCALHVGKLPVAIPVLRDALGLTLLQAGFLLSLVQLAGMTLGLVVGLMADRLGTRRVMLAGLMLLALGSALGAAAPNVNLLLLTRVVEGMGFLMAVLPAPGLLRQRVAHAPILARALGWWGAYMPLGTALALLLGAPLIQLVGWRWAWLTLAAVSLCAAGALLRWVPASVAGQAKPLPARLWPRLSRTLRAPGPWLVAVAFFLYSGQWLAVVGFLPTIYSQAGYSGAVVGMLSALAAGINMVGNIGAGRLLARGMQPGLILTLAYGAMGLGAWVAFAAQGYPVWQYLAVLVFSGVGGLVPGTLFGLAVVLAPGEDTVSTTVGWMQQFSSLGQFLGPPLVAWLAMRVGGWHWTWVATGACSLLGVWAARRLQVAWQVQAVHR
ncbi:MAG: MFS transporter [Hydrogenophaga sp.]|uniref:MFS transporter n=1 Tax=Hydrogenophaga sp. TaxID=1904254 RepID=UPI00271F6278|nr:MFS transporter [Hydrogenophaga sp.]MDO9147303.1 MFS transporter [Hydrogenophaga sp.]MDO9604187.1 MFS transporter [Hydrogenophaga sp.]MDP2164933.1 MFS transporter [Hydrogenophaga sp.]MDP3477896.1 MFS transporter [Hydrogenophaga sp.]